MQRFPGAVAVLTSINTGMSEMAQKNLLFYLQLYFSVTASYLTYENYLFGVNLAGKDIEMGPIYFNFALQAFNMGVAYYTTQ